MPQIFILMLRFFAVKAKVRKKRFHVMPFWSIPILRDLSIEGAGEMRSATKSSMNLALTSFGLNDMQEHEETASSCVLAVRCIVLARCVAVRDRRLGYIVLPPLELWGPSLASSSKWARDSLRYNGTSVWLQFNALSLYRDNRLRRL